jgi:hypothetical protein
MTILLAAHVVVAVVTTALVTVWWYEVERIPSSRGMSYRTALRDVVIEIENAKDMNDVFDKIDRLRWASQAHDH